MTRLLALIAIALIASVGALIGLMSLYLPGVPLGEVLTSTSVVTRLCLMVALVLGVVGVIGAVSRSAVLARIAAGAGVLIGLLGAVYVELINQLALAAIGPVSFAVTAPARVESLISLALGLGVALISLGLLRLRSGRPERVV